MAIGGTTERALRADLQTLTSRQAEAEAEHREAIARERTVRIRALRDELARIVRRHAEIRRELSRYASSDTPDG